MATCLFVNIAVKDSEIFHLVFCDSPELKEKKKFEEVPKFSVL